MGLFDFLPGKEKPVETPTNRPTGSSAADSDAPPAYHAVAGGSQIQTSMAHDARVTYGHLQQADNEDAAIWSCRGCGITNAPVRYKCLLCHSFSLCFECHKNPTEHHTKHAPHNFALVTATEGLWGCDGCGTRDAPLRAKCRSCPDSDFAQEELIKKKRAGIRWDCKYCGNDSLCTKCFEKVDKKHKKHPRPEDFAPVLYLDMCVDE
ncbi:hypothetical protein FRC08_012695 [Ceratobasidium sp. 394]|nr:hypothetical protein FRC08_012695 [Ceratobasidium sp. 394]